VPPVNHESPLAPLTARFRRVESISPIELTQMHALFSRFYENADLATFIKDLSEKSGVIMVREKNEAATIRGFSTIKQVELDDDGRPAIGVFSGDTILHPDYWGDRALKDGFVRYMLGVKARMPRTPIYWLLISKGYKTYLLLANNFVTYYPRADKPSDPRLRGIVDQYCRQLFPRAYNPTKGILDFGDGSQCLRDPVAPITAELRAENPAIAFFEDRNPEWHRGVELPCVGEVSLNLLWPYLAKESSRMRSSAPPPGALATELGERMPSLADLARQIRGRTDDTPFTLEDRA
jgi:hypothetical protein